MSLHIVPCNDEREHELTTTCWCEPRVDFKDPETGEEWWSFRVIHYSADCRELCEEVTGEKAGEGKEWELIEV